MGNLGFWLADASDSIISGAKTACGTGAASACNTASLQTVLKDVANTLVFLVGALSVIMIIVSGLRYVTANGDSKRVQAAKDTIQYAIAGLVIAILSYAIVHFVIATFAKAK
jgi:hypothetical protein